MVLSQSLIIVGATKMSWIRRTEGKIKTNWFKSIIQRIKLEIRYRKKLKELKKRDPFIYK